MCNLEFKHCKKYDDYIKQGHCPFDTICTLDCYFSSIRYKQAYEELVHDYQELSEESWNYENMEDELRQVQDDNYRLEQQKQELLQIINFYIDKLDEESLQQFQDMLINLDYDYYEIREKINEKSQSE